MGNKFGFLLILVLFLTGCGNKKEGLVSLPEESLSADIDTPAQEIDTFSLEGYTQQGKKQWQLEGKSADVLEDVVKLDRVVAKTYGEEGEINLKSDKGEYDKKEGRVRLEENVVVTTSEGTKLTTDALFWDAQKEQVTTDRGVVIERDNLTAQGKGAIAFPEIKQVKLNEEVRVEIAPKTTITCSGPLELDYEKNISVFYNNVEVEDGRGRIFADRMEVYFHPKEKAIEKIFAYGNVRLVQGENISYSDEAVYNAEEGKVTLKGNPRLVIYPKD